MNEIEEFLRRAAALRAQQRQQRSAPLPPVARPAAPVPLAASAEILDAEVVEADEVSGDDVARHVREHLSALDFDERSRHAAELVRAADDKLEAHLHGTFEHRLGELGAMTSRAEDSILDAEEEAAKARPATVPEFLRILRSPLDLRNAIILAEVIMPPRHRW